MGEKHVLQVLRFRKDSGEMVTGRYHFKHPEKAISNALMWIKKDSRIIGAEVINKADQKVIWQYKPESVNSNGI